MKKEFVIGLVAIIAGTILYLGLNFLKGADILGRSQEYYMYFDRVNGLEKGNPVVYKGFGVGLVTKIHITDNGRLRVDIEINKPINITQGTKAVLKGSGLLGNQKIELLLGSSPNLIENGSEMTSEIENGGLASMQKQAGQIGSEVEVLLVEIKELAQALNHSQGKIDTTLDNFKLASFQAKGLITENRLALRNTLANIERLTRGLRDVDTKVNPLLDTLQIIANDLNNTQLKETVDQAHKAMGQLNLMLTNINTGNGTVGKLMVNDSLYNNLNSATESLDRLLIDLNEHPKRYVHFSVFGRKEK